MTTVRWGIGGDYGGTGLGATRGSKAATLALVGGVGGLVHGGQIVAGGGGIVVD